MLPGFDVNVVQHLLSSKFGAISAQPDSAHTALTDAEHLPFWKNCLSFSSVSDSSVDRSKLKKYKCWCSTTTYIVDSYQYLVSSYFMSLDNVEYLLQKKV